MELEEKVEQHLYTYRSAKARDDIEEMLTALIDLVAVCRAESTILMIRRVAQE